MNKYKKESKKSQKEIKKRRMCLEKKKYKTEEEAFQKGQRVYLCKYCNHWHRSGSLSRLISKVSKINKKE